MPRTADFRVLAGLDLDVLGCPDFGAALAHERKLVAARHALVAVRGGLIAVEVRCRKTADQNDGVEHDRFISRVGQPTGQRHWFVASSRSKVRPPLFIGKIIGPFGRAGSKGGIATEPRRGGITGRFVLLPKNVVTGAAKVDIMSRSTHTGPMLPLEGDTSSPGSVGAFCPAR